MKILYVINNAYTKGNGLAESCRRTVKLLKERGHDVRLLSGGKSDTEKPEFFLDDFTMPVFNGIIKEQGYSFAKADKKVITEAIRWADVVHLEEPFELEIRLCKIARKYNIPITGTYHLHPENLFASVHLENTYLNTITLVWWKKAVFNHCSIIQCPTENVRERLLKFRFKSELRVISNGMVLPSEPPLPHEDASDGTYTIISTGRFSREKDQPTLLKAMKYSAYKDRIRLIFAGKGPTKEKLQKQAEKLYKNGTLKYPVTFGFYTLDELKKIYSRSDLYIHCATIEVEGMSCMEAIQTGLVPIIAEGKTTATSQFALNSKSIFRARNARELAERIDYWLSNDELRKEEARKYIGLEKRYDISNSIDELIKMYEDAVSLKKKK